MTEQELFQHMAACWLLHSVTPKKHAWEELKKIVAEKTGVEDFDDHMVVQTGLDPVILRKLFKVLENNQVCEDKELRLGKALNCLAKMLDCEEELQEIVTQEM